MDSEEIAERWGRSQRWWDSLTISQRRAVALELASQTMPELDWSVPWERLMPFSQQLRLEFYYCGYAGRHPTLAASAEAT